MELTLTLAVHDLERTAAFYTEVLLLPVETFVPAPGHPPVLLLRRGDATLIFRAAEVLEALHPALLQNLDRHPWGVGMNLEFTLPALSAVRRQIERRGLHILYELEDAEFGRSELWLHDPDGYLLILASEEGRV